MVFFFSSRRRHTRLQGDWSSDVCSSDLGKWHLGRGRAREGITRWEGERGREYREWLAQHNVEDTYPYGQPDRSEERRVGKECRARGAQQYEDSSRRRC